MYEDDARYVTLKRTIWVIKHVQFESSMKYKTIGIWNHYRRWFSWYCYSKQKDSMIDFIVPIRDKYVIRIVLKISSKMQIGLYYSNFRLSAHYIYVYIRTETYYVYSFYRYLSMMIKSYQWSEEYSGQKKEINIYICIKNIFWYICIHARWNANYKIRKRIEIMTTCPSSCSNSDSDRHENFRTFWLSTTTWEKLFRHERVMSKILNTYHHWVSIFRYGSKILDLGIMSRWFLSRRNSNNDVDDYHEKRRYSSDS